jgi:undecaprenyl-diphosphatase
VLTVFHRYPLPWLLDQLMLWIPYAGTNLTMLPLMLAVGLWLWRWKRRPLLAMHLLVVAIGSLSLNPTMKYLLDRDRPKLYPPRGLYDWASYPSGHAILTTALYFTAALVARRERGWRWPFVVAPAVVLVTCYSRLYLSVHWPTDLVGGLLIGITWLLLTWRAFRSYYPDPPTLNRPLPE